LLQRLCELRHLLNFDSQGSQCSPYSRSRAHHSVLGFVTMSGTGPVNSAQGETVNMIITIVDFFYDRILRVFLWLLKEPLSRARLSRNAMVAMYGMITAFARSARRLLVFRALYKMVSFCFARQTSCRPKIHFRQEWTNRSNREQSSSIDAHDV
jgi:hypothetical protein